MTIQNQNSIEEYFGKNNICAKDYQDITKTKKKAAKDYNKGITKQFYDLEVDGLKISLNYNLEKRIFEEINNRITSDSNVIELGCGSGILGCYLALKASSVYGIDTDKYAIKSAQQRSIKNSSNNVTFEQQDMFNLLNKKYDSLVVHYLFAENRNDINESMVLKAMELSDQLLIAQNFLSNDSQDYIKNMLNKILKEKFETNIILESGDIKGTRERMFLLEAYRK